jgi:hypothetical protein
MSVSVLLIGAGGVLGQPLLQELIRQKDAFKTIGVLATTSEKVEKFSWVKEKGVKVVEGSFLESKSNEGRLSRFTSLDRAKLFTYQALHMSSLLWVTV